MPRVVLEGVDVNKQREKGRRERVMEEEVEDKTGQEVIMEEDRIVDLARKKEDKKGGNRAEKGTKKRKSSRTREEKETGKETAGQGKEEEKSGEEDKRTEDEDRHPGEGQRGQKWRKLEPSKKKTKGAVAAQQNSRGLTRDIRSMFTSLSKKPGDKGLGGKLNADKTLLPSKD